MRIRPSTLVFLSSVGLLWGCGTGTEPRPSQAVMHDVGKPAASTHQGAWTKADMIAVVEKAQIPEEQKKAEIAKINSQPGN